MNKHDLVAVISSRTGLTQKRVKEVLEAILNSVVDEVRKNKTFAFHNFGKFELKTRKQRKGVNPKTGDTILIPPKDVLVFRPSKNLIK
ncbi:MAG: HU family DNA-binding protein [Bacteroidetes bacterium]|nr:HU family DNA-binding protein [Bacteroidota bacterium]MBU2584198.1 HU family DNA-binding protein [Bacteroidota bacterium]